MFDGSEQDFNGIAKEHYNAGGSWELYVCCNGATVVQAHGLSRAVQVVNLHETQTPILYVECFGLNLAENFFEAPGTERSWPRKAFTCPTSVGRIRRNLEGCACSTVRSAQATCRGRFLERAAGLSVTRRVRGARRRGMACASRGRSI